MNTNDKTISRRSFLGASGVGIAALATGARSELARASSFAESESVHAVLTESGNTLRVFAPTGRELWSHASFGTAPMQLNGAKETLVMRSEVLVANAENGRVERFGVDGRYLGELSLPHGSGRMSRPVSIAPFGEGILVADSTAHRLYEFDQSLIFVRTHLEEQLNGPSKILTVNEHTLILDRGNHRIIRLHPNGSASVFTSHEFYLPASMRLADDGTVRVAELGETVEHVFDLDGALRGTAPLEERRPASLA